MVIMNKQPDKPKGQCNVTLPELNMQGARIKKAVKMDIFMDIWQPTPALCATSYGTVSSLKFDWFSELTLKLSQDLQKTRP